MARPRFPPPMNILIVEDETFLAERIGKVFRSKIASNRVRVLHSYDEFVQESVVLSSYDLILTDLKLGPSFTDLGGYRIIRTVRKRGLHVPIIVISGFSNVANLQEAFELGANDYLIKPIRLKELEVRVMNWYRNYYLSKISFLGNVYDYRGLTYDIGKNEFSFAGKRIPLTKKSKYLLSVFFSSPEQLLQEEFLVDKIWGDICITVERPVRVNVLRLKQALAPFGLSGWIANVRGEGYVFSAPKS